MNSFPRSVQFAQQIISSRLNCGDFVIDATVGNGHDTLFLAKLVGETGAVIGFDVQESAIESTRGKTSDLPWVTLHNVGHEQAGQFVDQPLKAVMFNLGYLPGSGKHIITRAETTLQALEVFTRNLTEKGVITVVLYTGHEGGPEEAAAVREWCAGLEQTEFTVIEYRFLNQKNSPPELIAIERK